MSLLPLSYITHVLYVLCANENSSTYDCACGGCRDKVQYLP